MFDKKCRLCKKNIPMFKGDHVLVKFDSYKLFDLDLCNDCGKTMAGPIFTALNFGILEILDEIEDREKNNG